MQITMQATIQPASGGADVRVRTLDFGGDTPAIEIVQDVPQRIDPATGAVCGGMILVEAVQANELIEAITALTAEPFSQTATVEGTPAVPDGVVIERESFEAVVLSQEGDGRQDEVRISFETAPALGHLLTAALAITAPALVAG